MPKSSPRGMPMNLRIRKVWELLDRFKDQCELRGWKTSEHEDWVKTGDDKYHNFLWVQTVHPSTFEKIFANHKVAIRKDCSYQVEDVSYIAWLFLQSPPEKIVQRVKENPECLRRIALYDLNWAFTDKSLCLKLNKTNSTVFKEFENFLEWELRMKVEPIHKMLIWRSSPRARAEVML